MAVLMAATFGLAGTAGALTTLSSADCGAVLGVAPYTDTDYVLGGNMSCTTTHGLIIGTTGITIDGAGYFISGNLAGYDCRVTDVECVEGAPEHPQPCRSELPSGVFNAVAAGKTGSGCFGTVAGQGGCDDVVVKNLEIKGFCNGIFMSGNCAVGGANPLSDDDLLTGIQVIGNYVHDNGKSDSASCDGTIATGDGDCATYTENLCANDGIFLTMTGQNVGAQGLTAALNYSCTDAEMRGTVNVQGNVVMNQKGYARETGPAGNGINVLGGIEENTGDTYYSACGLIASNISQNNEVSGIMVTTATNLLIKANKIKRNAYGGITIPCDFNPGNVITDNYIDGNGGPGIGAMCWQVITENIVQNAQVYSGPDLGFSTAANGIYVEESGQDPYPLGTAAGAAIVVGNKVSNSTDADIEAATAASIDCSAYGVNNAGNFANDLGAAVPAACKASSSWTTYQEDVDDNGAVDGADVAAVFSKWGIPIVR
jgi:hypothetical protein